MGHRLREGERFELRGKDGDDCGCVGSMDMEIDMKMGIDMGRGVKTRSGSGRERE